MFGLPLARILAAIALSNLTLVNVVSAEDPPLPEWVNPSAFPGETSGGTLVPVVARVEVADVPLNGQAALAKMLTDAKAAHGKHRDYMAHMVRQERVNGTLLPEQVAELRVRMEPLSVSLKLIAPKAMSGWECCYIAGKFDGKMRFKPAGVAGTNGFTTVPLDHPKAAADSLHPIPETGLMPILTRIEKMLDTEKKANNPVLIVASDYTFQNRAVTRYEILTERPHPRRYAHRTLVFVDKETRLPVRFETYDQPRAGATTGDLIECVSFVNLKFNAGLGDSAFDR